MASDLETAKRVTLLTLTQGKFIEGEDGYPYLQTPAGNYSKVRVLGTVVEKFIAPEKTFASITLDDSTETMRGKVFKERVPAFEALTVGDLVEFIGRVRTYEDETYIAPDTIQKINDPNYEILHHLELIAPKSTTTAAVIKPSLDSPILEALKILDSGDGVSVSALTNHLKDHTEEDILESLRNLMARGDVYEPKKGTLKLV